MEMFLALGLLLCDQQLKAAETRFVSELGDKVKPKVDRRVTDKGIEVIITVSKMERYEAGWRKLDKDEPATPWRDIANKADSGYDHRRERSYGSHHAWVYTVGRDRDVTKLQNAFQERLMNVFDGCMAVKTP